MFRKFVKPNSRNISIKRLIRIRSEDTWKVIYRDAPQ